MVFKNLFAIIFNAPTVVDDKVQKGLLMAIVLVIFGPLVDIFLASFITADWAKAIFVILPLVAMFWLLATFPWPVTVGAPTFLTEIGRKIVRGAIIGVLVEILLGLYIALVPIDQNLGHALLLWPITLGVVISSTLLKGKPRTVIVSILLGLVGVFTLTFFGLKAEADRNTPEAKAQAQKAAAEKIKAASAAEGIPIPCAATETKAPDEAENFTAQLSGDCRKLIKLPSHWTDWAFQVRPETGLGVMRLDRQSFWFNPGDVVHTKNMGWSFWAWSKGNTELAFHNLGGAMNAPTTTDTAPKTASTETNQPNPDDCDPKAGWTCVEGEVKWVDESNWRVVISTPNGDVSYYAGGLPVQSPYYSDGISIRWLHPKDQIEARLNKNLEINRIWVLKDASKAPKTIS